MQIRLLIIFSIFWASVTATAQSNLSGKITDAENGQPIVGATVKNINENQAVATDIEGVFHIILKKNDKIIINVSAVGYQTKEIDDITAPTTETPVLNITLDRADQAMEQVIVRTSARKETVASLYNQQKNAPTISDGISADIIRRTPDKNTGDVLRRVSGATIQDNKFVIIRGLNDRYNIALLDAAPLPSTEPNRKAFSFDIVPSNLVDRIIISKTATPDLPADFTGGAVQIFSRDIPTKNFLTLSISEGYNTASTFKDFKSGFRNTTDYIGFDNGDKKLPKGFPSTSSIVNVQLTPEQSLQAMQKLASRNWKVYTTTALPVQSYQLSAGAIKQFKNNNRLGATLGLSYRNAQNFYKDVIRDYQDYNYRDQIYKFSTNIGALLNIAYTTPKSKISLKSIYNRIYDDQYLSRTGENRSSTADVKFFAYDLIQKALYKSTVEGTHQIGISNSKINWTLSYANIVNDQPDQRKMNYGRTIGDNGPYAAAVTTAGKENTRMFAHLNENNYSGTASYTLPFKLWNSNATFNGGISSLYRKRSFDARFIGLVLNTSDPAIASEIRTRPLSQLFAPDVLQYYKLDEIPNDLDSYNAHSLTNAGFAMLDNKVGEKSRVVWGVRIEQFDINLQAKTPSPQTTVDQNYLDILPSVNYTYNLTPKINLRASYYRTLARPEFRELATSAFYDYELLAQLQGNPDLKKATVDNGDIRFEFFPAAGQIISLSAFYKHFTNAIEAFNNDAASTRIITYFNSDKASTYGLEMEIRKTLDFIAATSFLKNTTAYTNLSLIKSSVTNGNTGLNLLEDKRPMVGQAPYVINAGLQHNFLEDKISFNAVYNRLGRRLNIAAGAQFPSVWEAPRDLIDLQLSMKVLKNKGELKINANDILNQRTTFYYDIDKNKKYNQQVDETLNSFRAGSTYSIAISYTL